MNADDRETKRVKTTVHSNDGMSGEELIDVRKMMILVVCVQTVRHRRRRELIFRK